MSHMPEIMMAILGPGRSSLITRYGTEGIRQEKNNFRINNSPKTIYLFASSTPWSSQLNFQLLGDDFNFFDRQENATSQPLLSYNKSP
jgi:hypothetical protein